MAVWGQKRRDDGKINDVVDQLFCTRFLDKGMCNGCNKELMGIYGPPESNQMFYCRKCWNTYLKKANDEEWAEWLEWAPVPRKCVTEKVSHHELKCALLALSRVGGTITFPSSLNSYDRRQIHIFCEEEQELSSLQAKSYGEGDKRTLTVSSVDTVLRIAEARALLQAEAPDVNADAGSAIQKPEKPTPDDSVTHISQKLEQLALDVPAVVPAINAQKSEQPTSKRGDTKDGHREETGSSAADMEAAREPRAEKTLGKATRDAGDSEGPRQAVSPLPPPPPQQPGAPQGKGASAKSPILPAKVEGSPAERPIAVQSMVDESSFPALGMAGSVKKGKKNGRK